MDCPSAERPGEMATTIKIKDLRLNAMIGVEPSEREAPRELLANITLELTDDRAGDSDDLNDTVNYSALQQRISAEVTATSFYLLEKLASFVLEIVMADPKVRSGTVEIDKPGVLGAARSVSVTFQRGSQH